MIVLDMSTVMDEDRAMVRALQDKPASCFLLPLNSEFGLIFRSEVRSTPPQHCFLALKLGMTIREHGYEFAPTAPEASV